MCVDYSQLCEMFEALLAQTHEARSLCNQLHTQLDHTQDRTLRLQYTPHEIDLMRSELCDHEETLAAAEERLAYIQGLIEDHADA